MFSDPHTITERLNLDPGMKVADLGSGSGFYTIEAAHLVGHEGKVYSIDIQHDLLKRIKGMLSRDHLYNVEVIHGDLEKIGGTKLRDGSIDFAIAANVIFQIEDKKTFFKEVKRILRRDGKVAVIDWADSFGGLGPAEDHVFKEKSARELALAEGFVFQRQFPAGDHHYGLVFIKKG